MVKLNRVQTLLIAKTASSISSHSFSSRCFGTATHAAQVGDRVLLRPPGKDPFMTKRLEPEGITGCASGNIRHSDIIGKKSRDTVRTSLGIEIRVHLPTLAEHITLTPRMVTPVYPADANFIVSLLDIHADPSDGLDPDHPPFEVLEVGTGHGSLTLHLARAIHAANVFHTPADVLSKPSVELLDQGAIGPPDGVSDPFKRRNAIIHTLEISQQRSRHAQSVIDGFRQGMYSKDIDFHIGNVKSWLNGRTSAQSQATSPKQPFLSHMIIDIPDPRDEIEQVTPYLHTDAGLIVFNPSVTQIAKTVEHLRQRKLTLQLERVFELGQQLTGGREWDVRSVRPRALLSTDKEQKGESTALQNEALEDYTSSALAAREAGWEMVCKPKIGYMVTAGGFVGLWKKKDY